MATAPPTSTSARATVFVKWNRFIRYPISEGALILSEPRAMRSRILPTRREAPAVAESIRPTSHVCVLVPLHLAGVSGFAGSTGVVSWDWRSHRAAAKAD